MIVTIKTLNLLVDGVRTTQLIALSGDHFAGTVEVLHEKRKSACIRQLFVREDFRKRGIGRRLIENALAVAETSGCETLGLSLGKFNEEAAGFYRKLGFYFAYQYDDGSSLLVRGV